MASLWSLHGFGGFTSVWVPRGEAKWRGNSVTSKENALLLKSQTSVPKQQWEVGPNVIRPHMEQHTAGRQAARPAGRDALPRASSGRTSQQPKQGLALGEFPGRKGSRCPLARAVTRRLGKRSHGWVCVGGSPKAGSSPCPLESALLRGQESRAPSVLGTQTLVLLNKTLLGHSLNREKTLQGCKTMATGET